VKLFGSDQARFAIHQLAKDPDGDLLGHRDAAPSFTGLRTTDLTEDLNLLSSLEGGEDLGVDGGLGADIDPVPLNHTPRLSQGVVAHQPEDQGQDQNADGRIHFRSAVQASPTVE
jgi:hypothetical protein